MENNLFLYEKRLKSHHDSNSLINKYIKSTPFSPKEFDEMLQKTLDNKKESYLCSYSIL